MRTSKPASAWVFSIAFCLSLVAGSLAADPLAFSDPAHTSPPPAHAIGFANRSPDFDAWPGFQKPPPGFGEVAFYWWLGDPLTRERLQWHIEQLSGKGVMGLQINYAHSDKGGRSYGLTYPSDPPLFSEPWWSLVAWFMQEAKRHGMALSLSDYTLGFGQGWYVDEVIREDPSLNGASLAHAARKVEGGREIEWQLPENVLAVTAFRLRDERIEPDSSVALRAHVQDGTLHWAAPAGKWQIVEVHYQVNPWSIDPMNPQTGKKIIEKFFQRFEDRNPGEGGKGLNFFFSDELGFGVDGNLWTARLAAEFQKRKGYDLLPELPALFVDVGPRTPKVRLDYRDVMVALEEEAYFRPVFEWHQQRGMIFGCDHGGRGREITEFGDYFRTMRWNQGPGNDQPHLSSDIVKTKVNSSIAHLYERPRVWLEGYYGSGWGTTSEQVADATFRNFVHGHNLLTLHGLYYSTHGGWWEWAPPCNHFHMPYWPHMGVFMDCVQRLSFLLTQGHHRCDVAILYPVATKEAGMDGEAAVSTAFSLADSLVKTGVDIDFIDFESLARAQVQDRELRVSGEAYRVLVLPAMKAVRFSTIQKALELHRGGGKVIALGALPTASDRAGRDDAELNAMVGEIFGDTPRKADEVAGLIGTRDYLGAGHVHHRRIGPRDVYLVYGAPHGSEASFRAQGQVELWNPWTGQSQPLPVISQDATGTKLHLPLEANEAQVIVFSPGKAEIEKPLGAEPQVDTINLDGDWDFELQPSLDNRFGDYHWPPTPGCIGPEARRLKYADESSPRPGWQDPKFDDSQWHTVTCGFGPRFWKLGPLPDRAAADEQLAALQQVDPAQPVELNGQKYRWQPYEFSWRFGIEDDDAHQGYHGLKEQVSDEFIGLGTVRHGMPSCRREPEKDGTRYYLWTSVQSPEAGQFLVLRGGLPPTKAWLNGAFLEAKARAAALHAGANPLLLRYDKIGRGYFVLHSGAAATETPDEAVFSPSAKWIWWPGDTGQRADRFFRRVFTVAEAPANARLRITCDNGYTVFVNGHEVGHGNAWERVQEYNVAAILKTGINVIAVAARNDGGEAGLIADLALRDAQGPTTHLATSADWRCAPKDSAGWRDAGFDAAGWSAAQVISTFEDSLWAKHPHGPPQLDDMPVAATGQPTKPPWNVDLAMRWYRDPQVLPFDTRPQEARPAGWYRFVSPPGLRSMTITSSGQIQVWADGQELPMQSGKLPGQTVATVAKPAAGCVTVAICVQQRRGDYGGAGLGEYITLDCDTGRLALGDWAKTGVLETYSGGAWYRKTVSLSAEQTKARLKLDLGSVVSSAEVRVNGRRAGIKVAPPWTLDITPFVRPGENRIEVLVYSTLANHYVTIPTHYRGRTTAGLLGPVTLHVTRGSSPDDSP